MEQLMSEIFANQHYFTTEGMEFTSKISRQFVYLLKHIASCICCCYYMPIILSVFWIFYVGIKFSMLKFSQGFIFAGLNFMNFFYKFIAKKQEIKDPQN